MAAAQPARFGAPGDDIADWMAQRWRDITTLGPAAEDAGRRLWAQATRSCQDLSAPNPSDVYALGAQFLSGGSANSPPVSQRQAARSQSPAQDTDDNPTANNDRSYYRWPRDDTASPPAFGQGGLLQLAAAPGKGFWDYWGVPGCANCHGYTPDTLPPYGGQSPFPPDYSPRRGSSGSSSHPGWSDRPQCNQQFETDRKICQKAGSAQCWENSNKRLGYCSRTGEVSIPPLGFGPPGR